MGNNESIETPAGGRNDLGLFPGCRDCLLDLAHTAAQMTAGRDRPTMSRAEESARKALEAAEGAGLTSPEAANRMLRKIREITGVYDPYAEYKIKEMAQAQAAFQKVSRRFDRSLASCLRLAVLGNSLDFFRTPDEAWGDMDDLIDAGITLYHDDTANMEVCLARRPELILYLTDNAGEIFFDRPLYDYLAGFAKRVVLVVKGGPALNDLTLADLEREGLIHEFSEVTDTGTDGAGIDWEGVSREFLDLFAKADLVLAKGMANFETVYRKGPPRPAFFLFKVKCRPIKDYLNAPPDSFWALWRDEEQQFV